MRIEPDGIELLRAARHVMDASIVPHVRRDRRELLPPVERALCIGEDRLEHEAEPSADDLVILANARDAMRGAILHALPEQFRFDARLVARAIALAAQQLAHGPALERREYQRLTGLLGAPTTLPHTSGEIHCELTALNAQLCARIRAGEADVGTDTYAATLAHLEATTNEALSDSNPMPRPPTGNSRSANEPALAPNGAFGESAASASDDPPRPRMAALGALPAAPACVQIDAFESLRGVIGELVYTSGSAMISTQATLLGCFSQRLAANPDVPMIVVEAAHQAHDLSVALADASLAFWQLALMPFRSAKAVRIEASRTS